MRVVFQAMLFAFAVGQFAGCRHAHLGEDTGDASRAAFAAQAKVEADDPGPGLSAADATNVASTHYSGAGPAGGGAGYADGESSIATGLVPAAAVVPVDSGSPSGEGGIRLRAK